MTSQIQLGRGEENEEEYDVENTAINIRKEVDNAIIKKFDPVQFASIIYPRIEKAIELAQTPEETNELRAQINTVNTYIKATLPKIQKDRMMQFAMTHEGDMLYCVASARAGILWDGVENKSKGGWNSRNGRYESFDEVSALQCGFTSRMDALRCSRIGAIYNTEDWRTYEQDTLENMRQPTINGLEHIWKMLYQENVPIPLEGKYRIIYADPPWNYGNLMPDYAPEQGDHYLPMSIEQICNMNVKEVVEDNAVLFLWVTSPILEDAFEVIRCWGFEYKTSFIWDKVKHNMGHYNSVRHEFLLVCTRGSCQPDVLKLFDSVVTIERTDHSTKPEYFREIIDTIYPNGKRIELFARRNADGWTRYGNEETLP